MEHVMVVAYFVSKGTLHVIAPQDGNTNGRSSESLSRAHVFLCLQRCRHRSANRWLWWYGLWQIGLCQRSDNGMGRRRVVHNNIYVSVLVYTGLMTWSMLHHVDNTPQNLATGVSIRWLPNCTTVSVQWPFISLKALQHKKINSVGRQILSKSTVGSDGSHVKMDHTTLWVFSMLPNCCAHVSIFCIVWMKWMVMLAFHSKNMASSRTCFIDPFHLQLNFASILGGLTRESACRKRAKSSTSPLK